MSAIQHATRRSGLFLGAILLCLALLCAAAASASAKEQRAFFLAGEASAEEANKPRFEGEIYPTYLQSSGIDEFEFGFKVSTLTCPGEFSGSLGKATPTVTLTSFYYFAWCSPAITITANGCTNTLTVLNQGPPYVGEWAYVCPEGKNYEFHHGSGFSKCSIAIPPQSGLTSVSLENTGEGKNRGVKVTFNVTGLKYSQIGNPFGPCTGSHEDGTFTGTMTVLGYDKQF